MSKQKSPPAKPMKKAANTPKKAAPVKAAAKTSPNPKSKSAVKAKGPSQGKPAAKSAAKPTKPVKTPPAKKAVAQSATKASVKQPAQTTVKKAAAKAPIKASAKKAAPEVKPNPKSKPKAKAATAPATPSKPAKTPAPAIVEVVEEVAPEVVETPVAAYRQSLPPLPAGPVANGAIYYDSHMHTPLCKHAWGEPEEYAAQGVQAGLKGIIFTCHCPMPDGFWPTVRMADSEFDTYLAMVDRTAKAFKGKLDVRLGLESEYFPGMEGWIEKLHQRADFDYILGAVHWQARDYLAKFETGTIEAFRKSYFNHLAVSAETGLYDCLAHPDLVKNYHPDSWCLAIVKGSIATALDRIAATGVAMELNTSGLNKSYSEMNPGMEMLRMMADRNIPIVVSSDAHRAQRVGEHFMTALSHLQEAGYDQVSYFLKRQRIDLKISEVQASIKKAADSQVA